MTTTHHLYCVTIYFFDIYTFRLWPHFKVYSRWCLNSSNPLNWLIKNIHIKILCLNYRCTTFKWESSNNLTVQMLIHKIKYLLWSELKAVKDEAVINRSSSINDLFDAFIQILTDIKSIGTFDKSTFSISLCLKSQLAIKLSAIHGKPGQMWNGMFLFEQLIKFR